MSDKNTNYDEMKNNRVYKIVRMYQTIGRPHRTIKAHLTLKEAQDHCKDPETSSSTCTSAARLRYTKRVGKWLDGFELMV